MTQDHFHMDLSSAARSLGVCSTSLKRVCRRHGISKCVEPRAFLKIRVNAHQMLSCLTIVKVACSGDLDSLTEQSTTRGAS